MVTLIPTRPRAPAVHVLMVEDDFRVGEPMSLLLSLQGYHVSWAINGAEALEVACDHTAHQPDIILMDLTLPDTDGVLLAHALRAHHVNAPIVMVSGQPSQEIASARASVGAAFAFQKPVPPGQVLHAIDDLVPSVS